MIFIAENQNFLRKRDPIENDRQKPTDQFNCLTQTNCDDRCDDYFTGSGRYTHDFEI